MFQYIISQLLTSPIFIILVIVSLIVCIAWSSKREKLMLRLNDLISKPVIIDIDKHPNSVPFYPRETAERISISIRDFIDQPLTFLTGPLSTWLKKVFSLVHESERPRRIYFLVFFFFATLGFVWADLISIANTLAASGALGGEIPYLLSRFDIAIGFGSIGAIVVSGLLFFDSISDKSRITDFDTRGTVFKAFIQFFCVIIFLLGFVVVIAFGIDRLLLLGLLLDPQGTQDYFVKFVWYIGVPLNTVLTTFVIAGEGIDGFVTILILSLYFILGILILVNKIAQPLTLAFLVFLDVVYRFLLFCANLFFYILFTPIDALITIITWPFKAMRPHQANDEISNNNISETKNLV